MLAGMFGFGPMPYFQVEEEAARAPVQVKF
jgi:hypothetical protein